MSYTAFLFLNIRNPYYKGSMGHKDISIVHAEAIGVQETVCIFERFMDMLTSSH